MKKHIKNYLNHYGYGEQDVVMCEHCNMRIATDIHHIKYKSQGGTDDISNLIGLCRECHIKAHNKEIEFNN